MTELIESKEREIKLKPSNCFKGGGKGFFVFLLQAKGRDISWNMKTGISSDYEKAIAECRNTETK